MGVLVIRALLVRVYSGAPWVLEALIGCSVVQIGKAGPEAVPDVVKDKPGPLPRPPNVPPIRVLWALFGGTYGLFDGTWVVLAFVLVSLLLASTADFYSV